MPSFLPCQADLRSPLVAEHQGMRNLEVDLFIGFEPVRSRRQQTVGISIQASTILSFLLTFPAEAIVGNFLPLHMQPHIPEIRQTPRPVVRQVVHLAATRADKVVMRFQMPVEALVRILDIEAPDQTCLAQNPQGIVNGRLGQSGHLRMQTGIYRIHGGMVVMMTKVAQHGKALHRRT